MRRRKVLQGLLADVRRAYWRAAAAERLSAKVKESIRAAEAALPASRRSEELKSPLDALRYQKVLLDLLRQLEAVQYVLETAKIELASLINLPLGRRFRIASTSTRATHLPPLPMPMARMEETALLLNPDIREQSYERRVTAAETRKAILRLIPGINLQAGPHWDSNSFLLHHHWVTGAAYLNGYLNTLLTAPATIRRAENNEILTDVRRQAVSMAVLTKLRIAAEQYRAAAKEYRRAAELSDVDTRLYQQIANRAAADAQGELEKVSAQVSALYSELRSYQSFAEAQAAIGRLYAALGIDQMPDRSEVLTVLGLNDAIKLAMRDRGEQKPAEQQPSAPAASAALGPSAKNGGLLSSFGTAFASATVPEEPAAQPQP